MKIIGIIPARYASTRFPGKPLVDIGGKTMIRRVYEQAKKTLLLNDVYVATDDQRIAAEAARFGGNCMITLESHKSGTDRCHEVVEKLKAGGLSFDVAINIQGDEPFIDPSQIDSLAKLFLNDAVKIATLIKKINDLNELFNHNVVKAVTGKGGQALYFSRQTLPFYRNLKTEEWLEKGDFYKHIGIYGYRTDVLGELVKLPLGTLEIAESLEQLRWLENGYSIHTQITDKESVAIDTPEDLLKISAT